MVVEEATMVIVMTVVDTTTTATMVEEVMATVKAVAAAAKTMDTQSIILPATNAAIDAACRHTPHQTDSSKRTSWTAMPTNLVMTMVANGATSSIDLDRPHLVQRASS